jgi:hypothetical protein
MLIELKLAQLRQTSGVPGDLEHALATFNNACHNYEPLADIYLGDPDSTCLGLVEMSRETYEEKLNQPVPIEIETAFNELEQKIEDIDTGK